jgi:hypothetical protein
MLGVVTDKDTDAATPKQVKRPILKSDTKEFDGAIKFIKDGGRISDIRKKYNVSTEIEALLKLK